MALPALKPFDWAALILGTTLTLGSAFWIYAGAGTKGQICIQGPEDRWVYPLDAEALIHVPGPLGDTVVDIRNGGARILSSPCAGQTCVAGGTVHRHGQWLACLPNGVLIRVDSSNRAAREEAVDDQDVDAAVW